MKNNGEKLLSDWWWENKTNGWEDLNSIRESLAWIDYQLINLITERLLLGWKVARIKRKKNIPIFASGQEERVISRWIKLGIEAGISKELIDKYLVKIVKILMDMSKEMQNEFFQYHSKPMVEINQQEKEVANVR